MEILSWPIGVNRVILSETNLSVGENAVQSDSSENGTDMTALKSSGAPDVYTVSMYFSNDVNDPFYKQFGKTEWQTFLDWFKYVTLMGTHPFYFHKIDDPREENVNRTAVYKIRSNGLPKGTPEGTYVKCSMTWLEYITDVIEYEEPSPTVDTIYIVDGTIDLRFIDKPTSVPVKTSFTATMQNTTTGADSEEVVINWVDFDGYKSAVLYFDTPSVAGDYLLSLTYNGSTIEGRFTVS